MSKQFELWEEWGITTRGLYSIGSVIQNDLDRLKADGMTKEDLLNDITNFQEYYNQKLIELENHYQAISAFLNNKVKEYDMHSCPYQEDVGNNHDQSYCDCGEEQMGNCAEDI